MPQVETSDPQKSAMTTALFMECVSMYAQQAMISMGKIVNPFTKKAERNLDAARLFIDMIEMLEVKTRGNLSKEEDRLLSTTLGGLRLTYVEEAQHGGTKAVDAEKKEPTQEQTAPEISQPQAGPTSEDENKKRYSKKYE